MFEYIKQHYNVSPEIGMGVVVDGKSGVIVKDCGNYIGVNFDEDEPGFISNCHPEWNVEYGKMRAIIKPKNLKSKSNYNDYLDREYSGSFAEFLGIKKPNIEFKRHYTGKRGYIYKYSSDRGIGEWKPTKHEAKASYKENMKMNKIAANYV